MWIVQWCETQRSKEEKALRVPTRSAATELPCRTPKASVTSRPAAKIRIIPDFRRTRLTGLAALFEGERGAVIAVEDYGGLERAPVLLGEALDRRRPSFDEQGFQLAVRQLLFRYRPEYGQAALRISHLAAFG